MFVLPQAITEQTRKEQEDAYRAMKEILEEEKAAGAAAAVSQNAKQAKKGKARSGRVDDEQDTKGDRGKG